MFPKIVVREKGLDTMDAIWGVGLVLIMFLLTFCRGTESSSWSPTDTYSKTDSIRLETAKANARRATERLVGDTKASGTSSDRQRLDHFSAHSSRYRALVQTQKPLAAKSKSFPSVPAVRPEAFRRPIENPFEKIEK